MADMQNKVKGGIDDAASKAKQATDQAGGMVESARQGVQQVADKAGEKAQEWAGDARQAATQAADRVQHWAEDAYDYGRDHMGDLGKEVTGMVRRYPIPALLVGFGLGLLIGRAARA